MSRAVLAKTMPVVLPINSLTNSATRPWSERRWALRKGGLLYLCATDSLTTAGNNPGKASIGCAAI